MGNSRGLAAAARLCLVAFAAIPFVAFGHPGMHEQEESADRALAESPSDPANHVVRGKLYNQVGNWDAAIDSFEQARRHGAEEEEIFSLQGDSYLAAGWTLTAKRRFDAALAHSPNFPKARIGRARAWMLLGEPVKAEEDFAVAFAHIERVSPALVLERRDALVAAGRSDEALAVLDQQIARVGQVPSLQGAAVEIEVEAGRYDAALLRVDKLLAQSPKHPLWAKRRADILQQAGRASEAQVAYRDALAFVQARSARRGSRRLAELEKELLAALASNEVALTKEGEQ